MPNYTFKIQRFIPEKDKRPRYQEYQVSLEATDRVLDGLAPPRRLERQFAVVADRSRDVGHELLAALRDHLVVRIGLVELEHRELGVVLR